MYAQSIPFLLRNLASITKILKKVEAFCEVRKLDKSVVLALRTYPDMLPLTAQILIMCDQAKGCAARLSGTDIPSYADDEKTFEELYAAFPDVSKLPIKKLGGELKLAGVWVPRPEKKKEKKEKKEEKEKPSGE